MTNASEDPHGKDTEITAMAVLASALGSLGEEARKRVLNWAISRFAGAEQHSPDFRAGGPLVAESPRHSGYETFAELFEAASPQTDRESALLAGYWVQVCGGSANFQSQTLNGALKDLGRGVGNITDALESLKNEKPALVLQLRKSGTSKQARKTYKLTQEGVKRVQQLITKEGL